MTQRSDNVKGSHKAREVDSTQWADIQRVKYDVLMRGTGEYLLEEPVMFGRAFSSAQRQTAAWVCRYPP